MSLWLPKKYVQMAKPICFWYNRDKDHIINPPSPLIDYPEPGYVKIECRHAHEVDDWSNRLRNQEIRERQLSLEERYDFEEPIRTTLMAGLVKRFKEAKDPVNKEFLSAAIESIKKDRELRKKEVIESRMACESREGVAS